MAMSDPTPREMYDKGYDDGLRAGLKNAELVRLQYQAIERHRDALAKIICDHNACFPPTPIVVSKEKIAQILLEISDD